MFFLAISLTIWSCGDNNEESVGQKTKVILDTDMVESFDDGIALMTLLSADNIDLLGVTTVTGNTLSPEGMKPGTVPRVLSKLLIYKIYQLIFCGFIFMVYLCSRKSIVGRFTVRSTETGELPTSTESE